MPSVRNSRKVKKPVGMSAFNRSFGYNGIQDKHNVIRCRYTVDRNNVSR